MSQLKIVAYGRPAPQGSKDRGAHGQMTESSRFLPEWRRRVSRAALEAQLAAGWDIHNRKPFFAGPVMLGVRFNLERPADTQFAEVPAGKPDLDKLLRAVKDALTYAQTWEDDSRVWKIHPELSKVWADGEGGMGQQGAVILVTGERAV